MNLITTPFFLEIESLGFSQIYLSAVKLEGVLSWFEPSLANFEPVPVRDFLGSGKLTLTDGHTRAYVAWMHGITKIPAVYDEDDIVICALGHELYGNDILWCERLGIRHISDFTSRILSSEDYQTLWDDRCDALQNMIAALQDGRLNRDYLARWQEQFAKDGLYLYGMSEDLSVAFIEDTCGNLSQSPFSPLELP